MKLFLRGKIFKLIILGGLLTIPALTAYFYFTRGAWPADAAWWDDGWRFRQAILVTNNSSAQSDVFISLSLNTDTASTSMKANCGDFRFTTYNGELLPYYIVSGCRTAANVIHVNFSSFPAGQQTIYFYYGNPSADDGFSAVDFATAATNYTIGAAQAAETGPGPVGYWSFDEGYGTSAHDRSGQGNHGVITGAVWQDESMCVSGKCLYFDGNGDFVQIIDDVSLHNNNFSVSFWSKVNSWTINPSMRIISKRDSLSTMDWEIMYNSSATRLVIS